MSYRETLQRQTGPAMGLTGLLALVFAFAAGLATPIHAASARSTAIKVTKSVPYERPEFKRPNDPNQLFFLQRSMNANTIVYAARVGADGKLDPKSPVDVYWRRFNDQGERKELGTLERYLAFGVNTRPGKVKGEYLFEFKALPGRAMILRQAANGKFQLTGQIGPYTVRPHFIFVDLDETSLVPRVQYLYLHGQDLATGMSVTETLTVSGGDSSQ